MTKIFSHLQFRKPMKIKQNKYKKTTLAHYNQTAENQRKKHSKQRKCILINYIQGDNGLNN